MEREEQFINNVKFSEVTRAISRDFFRMFCINADTNVFVEFIPHEKNEDLDIRTIGKDFNEVIASFDESVYAPDQDTFRTAVTKQNVLNVLAVDDSFTLDYRMIMDGTPTYVRLKATRLHKEDPSHVLIALSNTDAHMHRMAIYERAMSNQLTFAAVSEALTSDYDCIFYIDMQTGEFIEYSSSDGYKKLGLPSAGDDFFSMCKNEFIHVVYEEDRDIFLRTFDKNNLLKALESVHLPLLSFRIVLNDAPVYVLIKLTKMKQMDDHHIVLSLSNIEANLPRLQKYEQMRDIANKDSLTGVKSKHLYTVDEERLNQEIEQGEAAPFALAVFDVNGLKRINDTLGHQAGDTYLIKSSKLICNIFSHSPIYRIGGDEFVALLTGRDYQNRHDLVKELHNISTLHIGTEDAIISCGLEDYLPGQDLCVQEIFERADAIMYKDKMVLKSLGAATRENEALSSLQETEDIPSISLRKHILITDDQEINRVILGSLLEEDYDILYASDGDETIEVLRQHKDKIALLLLDLYMPHMNGLEVLREMQMDEDLMSIPVIMMTADPDVELNSLNMGAMDFISKPYPDIDIVKARIAKCIELSDYRDLIRHTQRDKLTSLLHFEYFLRYVNRYDQQHKETSRDFFVCDIKNFHSVNEKYGRQYGDLVLQQLGIHIGKLARVTNGIGCRKGADTFLVYCPHRDDYEQLIRQLKRDFFIDQETTERIRLRFGVFLHANKEPDIEKRFSRAKLAADSVSNQPESICGYYQVQSSL